MVIKYNFASDFMLCWAAMVDYWQARLPLEDTYGRATTTASATASYFTKYRQDSGFAGLTCCGGPDMCDVKEGVLENTTLLKVKSRCAAIW